MYSTKGFQDNMHLAETDKDKRIFAASEAAEQKKEEFYARREGARQEKKTVIQPTNNMLSKRGRRFTNNKGLIFFL
jgi:hypothetical protein